MRNCPVSKPWMDFQVPSKIGLHFENVRRISDQSSSSSCGLELQSQWTRQNLKGVVGIARAFLAAGARSVLVTLWE